MPDHLIERKGNSFLGSLAQRTIFVSVCFLVLPVLALTGLLYYHEHSTKVRSNFLLLQSIALNVEGSVERLVISDRNVIEIIDDQPSSADISKLLTAVSSSNEASDLYLVSQGTIIASSNKVEIGKPLSQIQNIVLLSSAKTKKGMLYIAATSKQLEDFIEQTFGAQYPITVSLLDGKGSIVSSTCSWFEGKNFSFEAHQGTIHLKAEKGLYDAYSFSLEKGSSIAVVLPLKSSKDGVMVSMSRSASIVDFHAFLAHIISVLSVLIVGGTAGMVLINLRMARPLHRLSLVMKKAAEGERTHYEKDPLGFELNQLGHNCNVMIDEIESSVQQKQELVLARQIQHSLLPKEVPTFSAFEIGTGFSAATDVAGDFYDVIAFGDRVMMCVADAAGKGVTACLHSLSVRSMLRSYFLSGLETKEILERTNTQFYADAETSSTFVTVWFGIFENGQLSYANCGHLPAYLLSKEREHLTTSSMALGVDPDATVEVKTHTFEQGDTLLLFSDGIVEAHNPQNEFYGEQRLLDCMTKSSHLPPQQMVNEILTDVEQFGQGHPQHDDITLLVLKHR